MSARAYAADDLEPSPLGAAALAYAARGWPVFPLKPRDKVPLIAKADGGNGVHDATTEVSRVERWWTRCRDANIGLACGPHFWVLDADFGGTESADFDGVEALDALRMRFGPLPPTVRAQTGSGGWHFLFRADPRPTNAVRVLPGLDTRNTGGYIVAPPSVHPSGMPYTWVAGPDDAQVVRAPDWLIALVEPLDEDPPPPRPERPIRGGDVGRYAEVALVKACRSIEQAAPGTQCDTLDHESYSIGRLVAGGVIPHPTAETGLVAAGCRMRCQAGRSPWTRRQVVWRVARALAAGANSPRMVETDR